MTALGRLCRSERGVGAIEFALTLPLLVLLLMGTIDFGRVILESARLTAVARAGAQYAAFNGDASISAIIDAARRSAAEMNAPPDVKVRKFCACVGVGETDCAGTCADSSSPVSYVEVSAAEQMDLLFSYPGIASPLQLDRSVSFRVL